MPIQLTFVGPINRPDPARVQQASGKSFDTVEELLGFLGYLPVQFPHIAVLQDGVRLHHLAPVPSQGELIVMVPTGGG